MKWIFKIKYDGLYCYILVEKGYLQKEGVDYDLSHSHVLCDVSLRILLIYYLQNYKFKIVIFEIKNNF